MNSPTSLRCQVPPGELPPGAARHDPLAAPSTHRPAGASTPERRSASEPLAGAPERTPPGPAELAHAVRDAALELGFARVGFSPVEPFDDARRLLDAWLARGLHGEMAYLAGAPRADPGALLAQARSLIVVALPYGPSGADERAAAGPGALLPARGLIARYARGVDYHGLIKARLRELADRVATLAGRPVLARPCVDSAPLLEREAARRSGVGFSAKSTLTIAPGLGSYVLLGELLVDVELAPSAPISAGCGSCRTCLDACPTGAFLDAYTLDARRCISYLTIELRGAIPRELRPAIGRWVFGCDVCQEVCPYNGSPKRSAGDPALSPLGGGEVDLVELLSLSSSGYRRLVRGRALARVSRACLQRNAAVALGNLAAPSSVPALAHQLAVSPSALVRGHCAWALGRIGTSAARQALGGALEREADGAARREIQLAISEASP